MFRKFVVVSYLMRIVAFVKNKIMNKTVRAPDVKRRMSRSRRESDCFFMIMS